LLRHTWSECGGLLNGVAVADRQALSMGGTALLCLVKMFQHQRHGVFFAAVLLPPLGATLHAMLVRAGLWAAVCGPDLTAFGRVVECGRVNCAFFGRRRPKKAEDAVLRGSVINNFLVLY
jgi:hypothetical protein